MKRILVLLTLFVLAFQPLMTQPAYAANVECQTRYTVKSGDSIGSIMRKYPKLTAWDLIYANNRYVQRPNYPIYVGMSACIPKDKGNKRAVSASVINQPAAEIVILKSGTKYTVHVWGWALGSNWWIKANNSTKVGKLLITTKNRVTQTFTYARPLTKICFKNQLTDALLCYPAPK